jgi:hypothetical protein
MLVAPIGRRLQLSAFGSAMRGQTTRSDAGERFVSYAGGVDLRLTISRRVQWSIGHVRQESDLDAGSFLTSQELRSYETTFTTVAVQIAKYLYLNGTYSYAEVDRLGTTEQATGFRRQSVVASLSTSLPLFGTVRK